MAWQQNICIFPILLAIACHCPTRLHAQSRFITFVENKRGQNFENLAHTALKDPHGFIWFATEKGLVRWDGLQAKIYQHDPEDSTTLRNHSLYSQGMFWNETEQTLWIPTTRALSIFDPLTEKFEHYGHVPGDSSSLPSENVDAVIQDRQGTIWLATDNGLARFTGDRNLRTFQAFHADRSGQIRFKIISRLNQDIRNDSILWMGISGAGLIKLNKYSFEAKQFFSEKNSPFRSIKDLMPQGNGLIFLRNWQAQVIAFNPQKEQIVKDMEEVNYPEAVFRNQSIRLPAAPKGETRIWKNRGAKGLYLVDPDNFRAHFVRKKKGNTGQTLTLKTLLIEENNTIWLGSSEGVLKESINQNQVENFFYPIPESFSGELPAAYAWPACAGVYRASAKQLILPAMNEKGLHVFNLDRKTLEYIPQPFPQRELLTNVTAIALLEDDLGLLAANKRLFRIQFRTKRLEEVALNFPLALIHRDAGGQIWLFSWNNKLYQFDRESQRATKVDLGEGESFELLPKQVFSDKNGNIWIDYKLDFLGVYQPAKKQYRLFSGRDKGYFRPSGFATAPDGTIYLSNYYRSGGQLGYIDPDHPEAGIQEEPWMRKATTFTRKDMALDAKGRLWILGSEGLEVLDLKSRTTTLLSESHGIITWDDLQYGNPAAQGWLTNLSDGFMAITYRGGLGIFHTDSLLKGHEEMLQPPKPYLSAIYIGGIPLQMDSSAVFKKRLILDFEKNDVAFEYSAIDHSDLPGLAFYHRLEGVDDAWAPSRQRYASYPNLPPGRYVFRIKVMRGETEVGTAFTFSLEILPPWYRTWWACTLWLTLFLGSIYGLYNFQLHRRLALAEAQRLQELDAVKTRLYTNITHEFRTPLTVILGMEEQLRKDPGKWLAEGLRLIRRNGNQLLNLVNQLLDLSKLESGHMPLNMVQGDIVSYLYYLIESFHSYADSKDIRLHFRPDVSELHMDYDPEKVQNVISNLLSNAIKFTPAGGDVYVDLRFANYDLRLENQAVNSSANRNSSVEIQVADNGQGIAPEHLPHIFDRFYQVDDSNTRRGEGTGIGLALVRELVRAMGGAISVESNVGKGTKFNIRLPVEQTAPKSDEAPPPAELEEIYTEDEAGVISQVQPSDRYAVLLVEDNPDVIAYLSSVLQLHYRIETACNGQEGIDKALEIVPDVIVSDVMMPGKDGFELCQALKTDERTSHIPIILLTAKADQKSKIEGLTHGADAYLAKPFDREELLVRVEKLIELRRNMQLRFQKAGGLRQALNTPALTVDELFLQRVSRIVEAHIADEDFGMPQLCKALNMSRSNLFRKLKALTGKSVTVFIRTVRLEKAKELLETTELNVSEVCFEVGFNSPNYFSKVFQEEFGVAPSKV